MLKEEVRGNDGPIGGDGTDLGVYFGHILIVPLGVVLDQSNRFKIGKSHSQPVGARICQKEPNLIQCLGRLLVRPVNAAIEGLVLKVL